jgi:hypothetical protein
MKSFQAVCPICKKTENTSFILSPEELRLSDEVLWSLLDKRADVTVMHSSGGPDHSWILDQREREKALAYTKPSIRHWFAVKVTFTCPNPACKKVSEEILYTSAGKPDPTPIASAVSTKDMKCQHCKTQPPDDTKILLNVLPVTLAQAKAAGFKPPPGMGP